jgi:hypothetical protein
MFVTKKEFEDAIKVLENALKNGQVVHGVDHSLSLCLLYFADVVDGYKSTQVSFVPPLQAAKNKQFAINQEMKKQREASDKNQRSIEKLGLESEALRAIISTLKE